MNYLVLYFFVREKKSSFWAHKRSHYILSLSSNRTLLGGYLEKDFIWGQKYQFCGSPIKQSKTLKEQVSREKSTPLALRWSLLSLSHAEQYFLNQVAALHRSSWKTGQNQCNDINPKRVDRWMGEELCWKFWIYYGWANPGLPSTILSFPALQQLRAWKNLKSSLKRQLLISLTCGIWKIWTCENREKNDS